MQGRRCKKFFTETDGNREILKNIQLIITTKV